MDPTLEHDLQSQTKPWALSPLISTMPYFAHHRVRDHAGAPFPPPSSLTDDTFELYLASDSGGLNPRSSTSGSLSPGTVSPTEIDSSTTSASILSPLSLAVEAPTSAVSSSSGSSGGGMKDDLEQEMKSKESTSSEMQRVMCFETAAQRRSYFSSPEKREQVTFGPLVSPSRSASMATLTQKTHRML